VNPPPSGRLAALLSHPLVLGALLLLPVVFVMPPMPIDETRYLAVAWEMRQTGEFLVPHLNGDLYSHKPPLLFWLVNLGWLVTGMQAWTGRAVILACSLLSVTLLQRVARRLGLGETGARHAQWVLLGMAYFALFANAIMFDVLLVTCVLVGLLGVIDLAEGRFRRGVLVTGAAIGLGILAKGPVILLDLGFAAVGAPFWNAAARTARGRYYAGLGLAVLFGAAIGLAWAIPAAVHGGPDYANAIFLHQTVDRVSSSFAHRRPVWWYLMVLPFMLLPWPLVLRGRWAALRTLGGEPALRLALVWVLPTFVAFSLISGKQPHYLLPLLPGVALGLAAALERRALEVRTGLLAMALLVAGAGLVYLPQHAAQDSGLELIAPMWPWWGGLAALLGMALWLVRRRLPGVMAAALAGLAAILLGKLALLQATGDRYDVTAVAAQVRAAQERGQPIAHVGWHHGVYEFAGRLTEPLATVELAKLGDWAAAHPDGLVISFYRRYRFAATPVYVAPFRGGLVGIWRAREAVASGLDPQAARRLKDTKDKEDKDEDTTADD